MPEISTSPASQEDPIWSSVRNPETPEEGLTLTVFGHFKSGARDWEKGLIAEFGAWPLPEDEAGVEETLKRKIRLRHAQRLAEADNAKPAADAPGVEKGKL